jgi:hypothetical protein
MLERSNLQGVWRALDAWYKHTSSIRGSKPSRQDLNRMVTEYEALYKEAPGGPIQVVVAPFDINYNVPSIEEIEDTVGRIHVRKSPGPTGTRTEHLKEWLAAATREENPDVNHWDKFVELLQHVFRTGQLPQELYWSMLVLIPKGSGSRGRGLLEVSWKVSSSIIDTRLKEAIQFHDTPHGFRTHRGMGTATIEAKLRMQFLSQG